MFLIKCSLTSIANLVCRFEINPVRRLQPSKSEHSFFLKSVFHNKSRLKAILWFDLTQSAPTLLDRDSLTYAHCRLFQAPHDAQSYWCCHTNPLICRWWEQAKMWYELPTKAGQMKTACSEFGIFETSRFEGTLL